MNGLDRSHDGSTDRLDMFPFQIFNRRTDQVALTCGDQPQPGKRPGQRLPRIGGGGARKIAGADRQAGFWVKLDGPVQPREAVRQHTAFVRHNTRDTAFDHHGDNPARA